MKSNDTVTDVAASGGMTSTMVHIREFLSENRIDIKVGTDKVSLRICRTLIMLFGKAADVRVASRCVYRLPELILMIFLAVLGGSDSCCQIEMFWGYHAKLYGRIFGKDRPIPSHDTFRRILSLIKPDDMCAIVASVLTDADASLRKAMGVPAAKRHHISIDGKQLLGTGREDTEEHGRIRDLQTLNVYDNTTDTCLYSAAISEKSNEIPKAQEILKTMDLRNAVVTFDAMNTQVSTIKTIASAKGDYVGGLKGNQGTLNKLAESLFSEEWMESARQDGENYIYYGEIAHNQLEERSFYLYTLPARMRKGEFASWSKANALVCYVKDITHNISGKKSTEVRYYLTSLKSLQDTAFCIREHWGVENRLHNGLDTVMMEDEMELTNRTAALNRSTINKMCLALLRKVQEVKGLKKKVGKKSLRKCFSWEFKDCMKEALTLIDPIALRKSIIITPKKHE